MTALFKANLRLLDRFAKDLIPTLEAIAEDQLGNASPLMSDARQALSNAGFPACRSLALYGLGFAELFDLLSNWLRESSEHVLIFFEDDLRQIHAFLQREQASSLLSHPQVFFVYLPAGWEKAEVGSEALEKAKPFLIHLTHDWCYATSGKPPHLSRLLQGRLVHYVFVIKLLIWDAHRANSERNFYKNFLHLGDCFSTKSLSTLPPGMPLLILGAGPSIRDELDFLDEMGGRGVLIGSGTGMNILNQAALEADLGVGFDPSSGEADRIRSQTPFSTPFFIDLHMTMEGLDVLQGPLFLVQQEGYADWKKHLLLTLGLEEELKIDWCTTSTQFAAEIASALGASSIFYVGIDMAFKGQKRYGGEEGWSRANKALLPALPLYVKNSDGREIATSKNFLIESAQLAKVAKKHPNSHYYYTSKEGLGIAGIPTVDLRTHWREERFASFDVENELHALLFLQPPLKVSSKKLQKVLLEWKNSIEDASEILREWLGGGKERLGELASCRCFSLIDSFVKAIDLRLEARQRYLKILPFSREVLEREEKLLLKTKYRQLFEQLCYHARICREVLDQIEEAPSDEEPPFYSDEEVLHGGSPPKEGVWLRQYGDGKKRALQYYRNGLLEGESTFFSPEGKVLAEAFFEEGLKAGAAKQYYRSGSLYSSQEWRRGKKEGLHHYYFENGVLKALLPYRKGKLEGDVKLYDRKGALRCEASFEDGLREGVSRCYRPDGKTWQESFYEKGVLQKMCEWDSMGEMMSSSFSKSAKKNGSEMKTAIDQLLGELDEF